MPDRIIRRLRVVHLRLKREIEAERAKRIPDFVRLLRLKKLRLAVKDRLAARLTRLGAPV